MELRKRILHARPCAPALPMIQSDSRIAPIIPECDIMQIKRIKMRYVLLLLLALNLHALKLSDILSTSEIMMLQQQNYTDQQMIDYAQAKMQNDQNISTDPSSTQLKKYCIDVNLKSDSGKRELHACMMIGSTKEEYIVKDKIITIFSSKTTEEVSSMRGKEKIKKQIQDTLHTAAPIYFTEFKIR